MFQSFFRSFTNPLKCEIRNKLQEKETERICLISLECQIKKFFRFIIQRSIYRPQKRNWTPDLDHKSHVINENKSIRRKTKKRIGSDL